MSDTALDVILSCNTTQISYFSPVKNIYDDDKMLVAKSSTVSSYYATYATLTSYLLTGIENEPNFSPQGQWNFENVNSMIYISVDNIDKGTAIPNLKYVNEHLLTALTALSAKLYGNNLHLPSYVGQIILGTDLVTHANVVSIYGSNTVWKKIEGRFLLGAGSNEKNTMNDYGKLDAGSMNLGVKKFGGQNKVALIGLPKHSHAFADVNFKKVPSAYVSFDLEKEGESKTIRDAGTKGPRNPTGIFRPKKRHFVSDGHHRLTSEYKKVIEESYDFKFAGEISDNDDGKWINAPHENIPIFQCTHIWERIQ